MTTLERPIKPTKQDIGTAIKWQIELISELGELVADDNIPTPPQLLDRLSIILLVLRRCYEVAK